jgi:hypothetical protein
MFLPFAPLVRGRGTHHRHPEDLQGRGRRHRRPVGANRYQYLRIFRAEGPRSIGQGLGAVRGRGQDPLRSVGAEGLSAELYRVADLSRDGDGRQENAAGAEISATLGHFSGNLPPDLIRGGYRFSTEKIRPLPLRRCFFAEAQCTARNAALSRRRPLAPAPALRLRWSAWPATARPSPPGLRTGTSAASSAHPAIPAHRGAYGVAVD